ncbi:MAG: hypothetical protein WCI63_04600, partial [bacterium]
VSPSSQPQPKQSVSPSSQPQPKQSVSPSSQSKQSAIYLNAESVIIFSQLTLSPSSLIQVGIPPDN